MNEQRFKERAFALADWTRDVRRQLHQIPEPGFGEIKTNAFIRQRLEEIGIPYTAERTWIIATITGGKPGKTVALRADIDALPIEEETGLAYASKNPGWMHACGHDAHTAIQLGAARLLYEARDEIPGSIRLLFQPAEETIGGAEPMIAAGAMDSVDAVYGLHVAAQAPTGRIATRAGAMYAACDELFIDVLGRSGHGAHPRSGVDAVAIAAQMICALQTLVSREIEATESAVLTFGSIHGGTTNNILCDEVKLHGTLRTLTPKVRDQFGQRIREMCEGVARVMGGDARVHIRLGYCPCVNDALEAGRVLSVAERLLGREKTYTLTSSSMGGEDFAYYLHKAPGAIYHLGCGLQSEPLHNNRFCLDEDCLPLGVMMQAALAMDFLEHS